MNRTQAGLSLLELLVAVAIMALGLTLVYRVSLGSLRAASDLAHQQRATLLAQSLLDARDSVPPAGWHEAGSVAQVDWRVDSQPLPPPSGAGVQPVILHEVTIVLQWPGRGEQMQQMQLRTLLPQRLPPPGGPAR